MLNRKKESGTVYWRCCKRPCPVRITMLGDQLLQQTNGHNHPPVNPTELRVEQIKNNLRKKVRKEVAPLPAI